MTRTDTAVGLLGRLDRLRARASDLVRRRAGTDPSADDPMRGLYLPAEVALHWSGRNGSSGAEPDDEYAEMPADGPPDRLDVLAHRCGLSVLDVHVLLTALAPEADRRFEPLYGFLNDDVSRRRATVSLALALAGLGPHDPQARARFHPAGPLVATGLLVVGADPERPFPGQALQVPERVVAHLLGDDAVDGGLLGIAARTDAREAVGDDGFGARLARALAVAPSGIHLRERRPGGVPRAVQALAGAGVTVLGCDLPPDAGAAAALPSLLPSLLREARLSGAAVVAGPLPERPDDVVRAVTGRGVPVVLVDPRPFDPRWSPAGPLLSLDLPPDDPSPVRLWADELGTGTVTDDLDAAVGTFRLDPGQVRGAVVTARGLAAFDGGPVGPAHLRRAARRQSAPLLGSHARHVEPGVGWDDIVLPDEQRGGLAELVLRARERDRVLRRWAMRPGGGRGHGVTALFAGESGTGKTLAAEVVAGELGVTLAVVDLSSVVDKYVGETEKNLDRIFTEADRSDAVLLFDEADAVFGKRSEVRDARDRYANLESAFLLQRLESFHGVAVLTTNLRANIDEAFTRRLDLVVDFPFPDACLRAQLWRRCLSHAPCAPDLDPDALGAAYELSGGAIRSAAVTAAYLAAGRGEPVGDADAVTGARREYLKAGRMVW